MLARKQVLGSVPFVDLTADGETAVSQRESLLQDDPELPLFSFLELAIHNLDLLARYSRLSHHLIKLILDQHVLEVTLSGGCSCSLLLCRICILDTFSALKCLRASLKRAPCWAAGLTF